MLKFVDLFSGIGGFHLAALKIKTKPFQLAGFSEVDPQCIKIYKHAFGLSNKVSFGDIRELVSGNKNEWGLPQFDFCFAGFPCQPFSNVGKRLGLKDNRSNVFYDLVRVINYYKPLYFVFENVEKIKTIENGRVLHAIIKQLQAAGYKVDIQSLSAENYGLPHQRKRLFFYGRRKKSGFKTNDLQVPAQQSLLQAEYPSTWHLLEKSMPKNHIVPNGSRRTIFTPNSKWMGDLEIDRAIARPLCATMGKWHRANQDNYYSEEYVFSKNGKKPQNINLLKDNIRRITLLEALRLQGFPDSYINIYNDLKIAATPAYKTIGNAVPVNLASVVIDNLLNE
jgi:DNA (cytosine-5)-methyltransferase 1